MDSIHRARIEAILYIAIRHVPDEIEDDDVKVLESIHAELTSGADAEIAKLIALARAMRDESESIPRRQALDGLIENLAP